jgi:hypothetical protein
MSATRPARLSDRRRAWRRSASNGLESFALGYVGLSIISALIVLDDIFLLGRPQPMAVMEGFADRLRDWHVRLDDLSRPRVARYGADRLVLLADDADRHGLRICDDLSGQLAPDPVGGEGEDVGLLAASPRGTRLDGRGRIADD